MKPLDRTRIRGGLVAILILLLACGLVSVWWHQLRTRREKPVASARLAEQAKTGHPLPVPRPDDYVGSRVCAECHADIAEKYGRHPMARSIRQIGLEEVIEDYDAGVVHDLEREYRAERVGDEVFHHERVSGPAGELLYDQAASVNYALGSGRLGRSYLSEAAGRLYQSPLGWYARRNCWDLSPGYREDRATRFAREVDESCLYCHAGRLSPAGGKLTGGTFFQEAAIGCERCHGPAGRHVAATRDRGATRPANGWEIVNPRHLDPPRREAVCNQCHLSGAAVIPRFGRGFFDFRPGDLLGETRIVLNHAGREDASRAVSQVEQMKSSRCFQASGGQMGCTTCHDPHETPAPTETITYYRSRCLTCHGIDDCVMPAVHREQEADNSCIACHMPPTPAVDVPHTALTDHRIVRSARSPVDTSLGSGQQLLTVLDEGSDPPPAWEVARGRGLWFAEAFMQTADPRLAQQAVACLLPGSLEPSEGEDLLASVRKDPAALVALGQLLAAAGADAVAEDCFEAAVALDASDAAAVSGLAEQARRRGDGATALAALESLRAEYPQAAEVPARQAAILDGSGRQPEAIAKSLAALELDPTLVTLRKRLVQLLAEAGDVSASARQAAWLHAYREAIMRAREKPEVSGPSVRSP
jgi:predicted CXXCH cytochrome family protein